MAKYTTKDGDVLDWVCWKWYGTPRQGVIEAVLEANPRLADHGPKFPAGVVIEMPAIQTPAEDKKIIRLWD